jgi:hypothetical protein
LALSIFRSISLIKIALGRDLWNVVDVFVRVGLIVTLFIRKKADQE